MLKTKCAICGDRQKTKELYKANLDLNKISSKTFSARRTPDRVHYRFVKCERCGLIFSNPILEPQKIHNLYKRSGFTYLVESNYVKKTYGKLLQRIGIKGKDSINLLDVGCGNGFFLEEAKRLGINHLWGIEPGRASVEKAPSWLRNKIKVDILRPGLYKRKFDVITCFHTLDHLVNPNTFLRLTHSLLKKGGTALFVVHDTEGLSVKLFGEKSPIFDIEHIYLFNKKSLKEIFKKNGFRKINVFDMENTYPLAYWTRMFPLPLWTKKRILDFLKLSKVGNISLSFLAGNIGVFAEK